MMDAIALRREDGLGLGVAVVLHLLLVAALLTQAPERLTLGSSGTMTVTIGNSDSEAGSAPTLGDPDAVDAPEDPLPQDELVIEREPQPQPTQKAAAEPKPADRSRPAAQPLARPEPKSSARPPAKGQKDGKVDGKGKSSFDQEFGDIGKGSGSTAEVRADIKLSIASQVAPFWDRCRVSGLDIDKLRAVVSFRLDRNGKLAGWDNPQVTGQNAANSAQAGIFGECAVRALRQVGTFTDLPAERYDLWQSYEFEFRKR